MKKNLPLYFYVCLVFHLSGGAHVVADDFMADEMHPSKSLAITEGIPSSLINQSVCAITGKYTDMAVDALVPGPEPLIIRRTYSSDDFSGNLGQTWHLNHPEEIRLVEDYGKEKSVACILLQPSGAKLTYQSYEENRKHLPNGTPFYLKIPKGLTNGSCCEMSGRTNLKNQKVLYQNDKLFVISGAGHVRTFMNLDGKRKKWHQLSEQKVNGNGINYPQKLGGTDALTLHIQSKNFSTNTVFGSVEIRNKQRLKATLKTSCGTQATYHFKTHILKRYKPMCDEHNPTRIKHEEADLPFRFLEKVEYSDRPTVKYTYISKAQEEHNLQISKKEWPDSRFLRTSYYNKGSNSFGGTVGDVEIDKESDFRLDRVRSQSAPVGTDETPIPIYHFAYHKVTSKKADDDGPKRVTEVYDAYWRKTSYIYGKKLQRLLSIRKFAGIYDYKIYSKENYLWGKTGSDQEGNLVGKTLRDGENHPAYGLYYSYDGRGNIVMKKLYGLLTGIPGPSLELNSRHFPIANGCEYEQQTYGYTEDGLNLLAWEKASHGKMIVYFYKPQTDLLQAKFTCYQDRIYLREFYTYDSNAILIQKIVDDGSTVEENDLTGVTERRLTYITPVLPLGLPEKLEEKYLDLSTGKEISLKTIRSTYTLQGRLSQQDYFDSNGVFCYSLFWEYDAHGNVTKEVNALGHTLIRSYDVHNNLVFEQGPRLDFHKTYLYDFSNRLIKEEEIHATGLHYETSHAYDYMGNRTWTRDRYGHETTYEYDEWGRKVLTTFPAVLDETGVFYHPQERIVYDILDRPICKINAKEAATKATYNIRGQPLTIVYPDDTSEQFVYNLQGELTCKRSKDGTISRYTRDFLGRSIREETSSLEGDLLKWTDFTYSGFRLLSSTDSSGLITTYAYDGAGRLISTIKGELQTTQEYDSLGRVAIVKEWFDPHPQDFRLYKRTYDFLDRLIEESIESEEGALFHLSRAVYDEMGNQITMQEGDAISYAEYNPYKQPIKKTDALGHVTNIVYDHAFINEHQQRVLQKITTDPLGYQTIETHDTLGRVATIGRLDSMGLPLATESMLYDKCGNMSRRFNGVFHEYQLQRLIETVWHYTLGNQIAATVEAVGQPEQKITRYEYNHYGQQITLIKPDGCCLNSTYDGLGRLKTLSSSDGSLAYQYEYNSQNLPISVIDLKNQLANQRAYDALGQIKEETLGHGLKLAYTYDRAGRVTSITLPDASRIEHVYNPMDLKEVHRFSKTGEHLYVHRDEAHNLMGLVTKSRPAGANEVCFYQHDVLGRCRTLSTDKVMQEVPENGYDALGNLLAYHDGTLKPINYHFTYDGLSHLTHESGHAEHHYELDSLSNRISKDGQACEVNFLNQVLKQGNTRYEYDLNGNLIKKIEMNRLTNYFYDALDRLVNVKVDGKEIHYLYDAFNRRLTRRETGAKDQLFIYQGQDEIGCFEEGILTELKVIGSGRAKKAVAIELHAKVYVPLYDLFNQPVCLVDLQGSMAERYRYTAFGQEQILNAQQEVITQSDVGNSWRFCGKRTDPTTGLVAFGRRDLDPELGKWLTADPLGFEDGPNLYAYLHHNPFAYFDAFGLSAESLTAPIQAYKNFEVINRDRGLGYHYLNYLCDLTPCCYLNQTKNYQLSNCIDSRTKQPYNYENHLDIGVGFVNGIKNSKQDFLNTLAYLGELTSVNCVGVHSVSYGFCIDAFCYSQALFLRNCYDTIPQIHKMLDDFFKQASANATFLLYCHSRGVLYTALALEQYPEELRQRINVVAIAPGGYIREGLCKSVVHYVSKADIVPCIDRVGKERCLNSIIMLDPHPNEPWINRHMKLDHGLQSETFKKPIITEFAAYKANPYLL